MTLDEVLEHVTALDQSTDLPVSADLENGYGAQPEAAALAITRAAERIGVRACVSKNDYRRLVTRLRECAAST